MSNRLVLGYCDNHPRRKAILQTAETRRCFNCARNQHGAAPFTLWRSKRDRKLCYNFWQERSE